MGRIPKIMTVTKNNNTTLINKKDKNMDKTRYENMKWIYRYYNK